MINRLFHVLKKSMSISILAMLILGLNVGLSQAAWITGSMFNIDVRNFTGGEVNDFEMWISNITCSDVNSYYIPSDWNQPGCEVVDGGIKVRWTGANTPPDMVKHFGASPSYGARTDSNPRITKIQWTKDGQPVGGLSFENGWTGGGASCRVGTIFRNTDPIRVAYIQRSFAPTYAVLPLDNLVPGDPLLLEQPWQAIDEQPIPVRYSQEVNFDYQTLDEEAGLLWMPIYFEEGGELIQVAELITQSVLFRKPEQMGDIFAYFTNRDGEPLHGLEVSLDGIGLSAVTDTDGTVYFSNVSAGRVSISLKKPFRIRLRGGQIRVDNTVLENAGEVTVRPSEVSQIGGIVDVPVEVEQPPCGTTPWCIVGGLIDFTAGTWRVRGAAGKNGPCPCAVATAGLPGPAACPGSGPNAGGPLPNPGVLRSVTTSTCLGGPGCMPPIKTVICSIIF